MAFLPARPRLEREPDEDRTKTLKAALERIWKQVDPWAVIIKRRSLIPDPSEFLPRRNRKGRFTSPSQ